ncbi:MAG: cytidine deaminase [Thermomicrobiales bacterium]
MSSQPRQKPGVDSEMAQTLLHAARQAAKNAYVPYSDFPVGAAVLTADGQIVTGANIENASYGLTVCGERVAVFTAAAAGHREVRAVAISTPRHPGSTPCGACRQVLNEFKPPVDELIVLLDGPDGIVELGLSDLLPMSFGPRDLS